jgi:drug/metabolite transporter (DMT)-like permease
LAPARYLVPYILITAFAYVVAKDALSRSSPLVYGALTSLLMTMALFAAAGRFRPVLNRDTLLFSLFYWLSGVTWLVGLDYISSAQSAIVSFTMPLFTIPLAFLVLRERGSRLEVYGAVVGFAGIVVFNLPLVTGRSTALGVGLTLADAFFWALYSVYMRKLRHRDTLQTLATASLFSFVLYSVFSLGDFSLIPSLDLAADVLFLGLVSGALTFYLWMALIKVEKVGRLTTVIFVAPIITLVYGVATTGVIPNYITLGGVALIFLGIVMANYLAAREVEPSSVADATPNPGRAS